MKLLEDNITENLDDLEDGDVFFTYNNKHTIHERNNWLMLIEAGLHLKASAPQRQYQKN